MKALKDETNGGTSSSPGRSWEPGLEIEVPFEQRPVSLLRDCKHSFHNWFMQIYIQVSYKDFEEIHNFLAQKKLHSDMHASSKPSLPHDIRCIHTYSGPGSVIGERVLVFERRTSVFLGRT